MKALFFILLLLVAGNLGSQSIIGLGTRYDDSFREWVIRTEDDDLRGEMRIRWAFRNDWTEWDVSIGDHNITIEQKWEDDPNLWEIRSDGIVINAKTVWPGEFNRWKLNDGNDQYTWGTRFFNIRDEWVTENRSGGTFKVRTYWEGDPRDWVVEDELSEDASLTMKVAMIFLAIHFSTPRI